MTMQNLHAAKLKKRHHRGLTKLTKPVSGGRGKGFVSFVSP
jgi:hypothetical protein